MLLTCDTTAAVTPSIEVKEGFGSAWEVIGSGSSYSGEATNIFIEVLDVPSGVKFEWPKDVMSNKAVTDEDHRDGTKEIRRPAGQSKLTLESSAKGNSAIYSYSRKTGVLSLKMAI